MIIPSYSVWSHFLGPARSPIPLQFNLRRAAKERIRRMVAPKAKRKDLQVPQYVKDEWENGDRDSLADMLTFHNFDKD